MTQVRAKSDAAQAFAMPTGEIAFEAQDNKTEKNSTQSWVPHLRFTRRVRGAGSGSVASQLDPGRPGGRILIYSRLHQEVPV